MKRKTSTKQILATSKIKIKNKNEIIWVNSMPQAVTKRPVFDKNNSAALLSELAKVCLNFPYEGEDPRYIGLTRGEAIMVQLVDSAANGDSDARKELLDRVMGKPQQNIKSVSLRGTLADFLDELDVAEAEVDDL